MVDLLRVDGARMSVIHRFRPARGDYGEVVRVWGRTAERIADLDRDGTAELVAGDVRFAGLGSPSVLPARIWQLRGEALADATPRFARYLTAGATRLYARSRAAARSGRRRFARGVLAAAVAQDSAAGQAQRADRRVAAALARGDLRPQRDEPRSAGGRAYVRRLHALLARVGYAS
jgi:hypothetical protein